MINDCPDCGKPLLEIDMGSGKFHCANPVCKFQYIDEKTGQEYRKTIKFDGPPDGSHSLDDALKKILVNLAIEKALFQTGNVSLFTSVNKTLLAEYNIEISDCMIHPKYLRKTLERLVDSKSRSIIINSIKNILDEFTYYKPVKVFLDGLEN